MQVLLDVTPGKKSLYVENLRESQKEDLKFDVFLKPSADPVKATHFDQTAT